MLIKAILKCVWVCNAISLPFQPPPKELGQDRGRSFCWPDTLVKVTIRRRRFSIRII